MKEIHYKYGYTLDPHGATGYQALDEDLQKNEVGIFLETAHSAKFTETVEATLGKKIALPEKLAEFMKGEKLSISDE